ncbi:hypothetical protein TUMEXPCC7403_03080 [Tumidithrix helvetica PCC 7403]
MCTDSLSTNDFEIFKTTLAKAINNAQSLDEIESWLKSQQCVKSVQLAGYLLKSNPPQRDFIVEFSLQDGSIVTKIVNVYELGNQSFQFHQLRIQ